MPELPEINIMGRYLESTSLNKKIVGMEILQTALLQAPKKDFEFLRGKTFKEVRQLGKYLFLKVEEQRWLGFHFGMTGKFESYKNQDPPKYTHLIFTFEDDSHLAFVCRRKLGKIYLTSGVEDFQRKHSLGKHALELKLKEFQEILKDKKGMIKAVLTDQHEISGIGNVYADEMLYQCNIHPKSGTNSLTEEEIKDLYSKMVEVLKTVIKSDGERSELPSDYLVPHRKDGADCPKCDGKVVKTKVSGRSTYFCPSCQKEK